jgi:hypothetical protein
VLLPRQQAKLARGAKDKDHAMSQTPNTAIAVIGIDIGITSMVSIGFARLAKADAITCSDLRSSFAMSCI